MNLARALDVALPELPAKRVSKACPRLHPKVVAREHDMAGTREVSVLIPGTGLYFRFSPPEWALLQLFNGERPYEEVSALAPRMRSPTASSASTRSARIGATASRSSATSRAVSSRASAIPSTTLRAA